MKNLLLIALLLFTITTFSQVKVEKEKSYLYLLTTKYEIITKYGSTTYYEKVFKTGYE